MTHGSASPSSPVLLPLPAGLQGAEPPFKSQEVTSDVRDRGGSLPSGSGPEPAGRLGRYFLRQGGISAPFMCD